MPYNNSNIWIHGQRLYILRNGEEWSFLGSDMGATTYPPGRFWIEGNYFCYIDANQRKRVIDTEERAPSGRPPYYVAIDPQRWLWFSKPSASGDVIRGSYHSDRDEGYTDHLDQPAHNDDNHVDRLIRENTYADISYDHADQDHENVSHENVSHENVSHENTSHENVSHENVSHENVVHLDTPYLNGWDPFHSDHGDHLDSSHGDRMHENVAHENVSHENTSHENVAHENVAHENKAYTDRAHENISHENVSHENVSHENIAPYTDTTHRNSGSWTSYEDRVHLDHMDYSPPYANYSDLYPGGKSPSWPYYVDWTYPYSDSSFYPDNAWFDHIDSVSPHENRSHTDTPIGTLHGDYRDHFNRTHENVSHENVSHENVSHENVVHLDTPYLNGWDPFHSDHGDHLDSPHGDRDHENVSHENVSHENVSHENVSHENVAHENKAYTDRAHENISHENVTHEDVSHENVAHENVSHENVAHENVAYINVAGGHVDEVINIPYPHIDHQDYGNIHNDGGVFSPYWDAHYIDHTDHITFDHTDHSDSGTGHMDNPRFEGYF